MTSLFIFSGIILKAQLLPFNPALKPFYHGVASGDPLEDRVIIWTRVTPDRDTSITGTYIVATDAVLNNIVKTGTFSTDSSRDYTVKVDVTGLQSNMTYYYAFLALDKRSSIGRTRTTPSVSSDNLTAVLKFAVMSCANYEAGYFNAYGRVADRNDLNAVIHLGDYYYEYSKGSHRNSKLKDPNRNYIPTHETVTKADYRLRHSLYRLDKDLQRLHQQHPIIAIWDDHEIANNAYETGSKREPNNESDWNVRKKGAKDAYFEWMPVREKTENPDFYRAFSYGKLMDLFMLDTRLEGRQRQPANFDSPDDSLNQRRIISAAQYNWLTNSLKNSKARWKVVGSQVIFSNINLGFAALFPRSRANIRIFQNVFLDTWQGYLLQRNSILDSIQKNKVNNVVVISGDSHNSWSFDLNKMPVLYPFANLKPAYLPQLNPYNPATGNGYNPETGEGSQGVEFSAPSISSKSFTEILTPSMVAHWEAKSNAVHPHIKGNPNYNPHMKFVNLNDHGYFILDVRADSIQSDYYYVPTITAVTDVEKWGKGLSSRNNSNKITTAATRQPALAKDIQDIPAPSARVVSAINVIDTSIVLALYPHPITGTMDIQYDLIHNTDIHISFVNLAGKTVKSIAQMLNQRAGIYSIAPVETSDLSRGIYILRIQTSESVIVRKIEIQ